MHGWNMTDQTPGLENSGVQFYERTGPENKDYHFRYCIFQPLFV